MEGVTHYFMKDITGRAPVNASITCYENYGNSFLPSSFGKNVGWQGGNNLRP